MRTRFLWSVALVLVPLSQAVGQRPDSSAAKSDSVRQRIEERFASRVQADLGLTNEQTAKLRATSQRFGGRRREMHTRQRQLSEALRAQLQPGVSANQDSVAKLTDAMIDLRLASAQSTREEMKEVSKFLNPVQRARLFVMRERLRDRVKEAREHHGGRREGRESHDRWDDHQRGADDRQRGTGEPHE